jgi:hypothetical protein
VCACLLVRAGLPPGGRLGGGAVPLAPILLSAFRDIHEPPILTGAGLATLMLVGQRNFGRTETV